VRAVVITGPPGAGKSSLATEVHDQLGDEGVANALIEVDELERAYPPLPADRVLAHVAALSSSYREAGHDLLFVTATIEDPEYGDKLFAAIGADARIVVVLTATPAALEQRIRAREPPTWSGLEALVASSARLASEVTRAARADLVLDTEALSVRACAERVRAALRSRTHGQR
jgi:broad-specificity NMP kinase